MYVCMYIFTCFGFYVNLLNLLWVINVPNSVEIQRDDITSCKVHVNQLFNLLWEPLQPIKPPHSVSMREQVKSTEQSLIAIMYYTIIHTD